MGPAATATDYFARLNFQCPPQHNPADYFLDLISLDVSASPATADPRQAVPRCFQTAIPSLP